MHTHLTAGKLSLRYASTEPIFSKTRKPRPTLYGVIILAIATGIASTVLYWRNGLQLPFVHRQNGVRDHASASYVGEMVWDTVLRTGTPNVLKWVPCYEEKHLECARIMLPLDYSLPRGRQAGVALVRLPASDLGNYRGPILINPGGPGGSGIDIVVAIGDSLQLIVGPEYDIVGFDPRGVARTIPQVVVFDNPAEGYAWRLHESTDPLFNTSGDAASRIRARNVIYGSLANERISDTAKYISSTTVARDMLAITKAFGYNKLQFWGFSYGTILGITYAAMFPDHVGRIIVDGVINTKDWYTIDRKSFLNTTDRGLLLFCDECANAGPSRCPIYEETGHDVLARVDAILERLKSRPIPVSISANLDYGILDYKTAKTALFFFLYSPYRRAVAIAYALAAVERGDGLPLLELSSREKLFRCECPSPAPPRADDVAANVAVICSDGGPKDYSAEELQAEWEGLAQISQFADMLAGHATCVNWKIKPVERFVGPFESNTSFPILFIGNAADPVTPVSSAHAVSESFPGSIVLTQDSGGHTSGSATSLCTLNAVHRYFREGVLPDKGTVCEVRDRMFDAGDAQNAAEMQMTRDEQDIVRAWDKFGTVFQPRLV